MRLSIPLFRFFNGILLVVPLLIMVSPEAAGEGASWRTRAEAIAENPEKMKNALSDNDFGVIYYAVSHLPDSVIESSYDVLSRIAIDSRFLPLRQLASKRLISVKQKEFEEHCISVVRSHEKRISAVHALDSLGMMQSQNATALLKELVEKAQDAEFASRALRVLRRYPTTQGFELLKSIASRSENAPALRLQALGALSAFRYSDCVDFLIKMLEEKDLELVDAAWSSLTSLTEKSLLPDEVLWSDWWKKARGSFVFPASVQIPVVKPAEVAKEKLTETTDLACGWLITVQEQDGHFDSLNYGEKFANAGLNSGRIKSDICMTGLAALAFISAGVGPEYEPARRRRDALNNAMAWLVAHQMGEGNYRTSEPVTYVHEQGIATWALAECYAILRRENSSLAPEYLSHLKAALKRCGDVRDGELVWGYPTMPGNTSNSCVTVWYACAYAAARSCGIELPKSEWEGIADWFDIATEEQTGYVCCIPIKEPTPSMTGVGLMRKSFLLWDMSSEVSLRSASIILKRPIARSSFYDLYYYALGLSRMNLPEAKDYIGHIQNHLIDTLDRSATPRRGSWDAKDDIWEASRIYTAVMAIPALTVNEARFACFSDPLLGLER